MKPVIAFTYDLRSEYLALGYSEEDVAEFDSDATIIALEDTIKSLGHACVRIGNGRALCQRLSKGERWDLVFNITEGVSGRSREAQVPALLELFEVPYTFSDPLVCALTLDKAMAKRVVQAAGLHTPRFSVIRTTGDLRNVDLTYPLFAKPIAEGTGKGIDKMSMVESPEQLEEISNRLLERFAQPVLVEEYLPGREFTIGILGTGRDARVLGVMEVGIRKEAGTVIYSYDVKEKSEELVEYTRPAREVAIEEVEQLALEAYRALEVRDAGRVDIRMDRYDLPAFMEVNPLPGLHPTHSDLPMIATQEGMSYRDLIGSIIESAMKRAASP